MCQTIRIKGGNDVFSVAQFEQHFGVSADTYKEGVYDVLIKDGCLCQIDLVRFFKENPQHAFIYEYGDWWEVKKRDSLET